MVLPDWALGQKTPPLEKISFGIPAMDAGFCRCSSLAIETFLEMKD
jgi:hypothetical protein